MEMGERGFNSPYAYVDLTHLAIKMIQTITTSADTLSCRNMSISTPYYVTLLLPAQS